MARIMQFTDKLNSALDDLPDYSGVENSPTDWEADNRQADAMMRKRTHASQQIRVIRGSTNVRQNYIITFKLPNDKSERYYIERSECPFNFDRFVACMDGYIDGKHYAKARAWLKKLGFKPV